jgi:hypothetical protein
VLLSRELSIPSRKVLKLSPLHRFTPTGFLIPEYAGSKAILARELVKGRTHPYSATPRGSPVSDP